ncbi:MAG TPA: magnesium/cobalt transporter CorA [Paludibacteraceae bacterium]|nr:magnesium/cobalt transporter CorA [Paludibacteraceae bacterium]HQB68953.1 magnesium/cobalt transporter CorA [Paludibacteraceae bacterium]HRS67469.1 magnesium/cobalt transporter CorA [Paludibacteraceae bacterium]
MKQKSQKPTRRPRIRQRDNLLYEQLQYTGDIHEGTCLELTVFDKSGIKTHTGDDLTVLNQMEPTKVNWLCVRGLSDVNLIGKLCRHFELPNVWMQDVLNTRHIAKIEEIDYGFLTVLDVFSYNEHHTLDKEHVSLLMKKGVIISFQESQSNLFAEISKALTTNTGKVRSESVDYLYDLLFSSIIDSYLAILDTQRDQMLDMEDQLMEFGGDHVAVGRAIQLVRKDYMLLRKNLGPLRTDFSILLESNYVKDSNKIYYRDTRDQLLQVFQLIDNAKETITALVDLYLANNDLRMNQIMSRLTVVSAIFIPLTFLAGVWGMNFRVMPELSWQYGYLFAWGVMGVVALGVIWWLWKKRWF